MTAERNASLLSTFFQTMMPLVRHFDSTPQSWPERASVTATALEEVREAFPLRLTLNIGKEGELFEVMPADLCEAANVYPLAVLPSDYLSSTRFGIGDRGGMIGNYRSVFADYMGDRIGAAIFLRHFDNWLADPSGYAPARLALCRFYADRFVWWWNCLWCVSSPWGEFDDFASLVKACPHPVPPRAGSADSPEAVDAEDRLERSLRAGIDWVQCHRRPAHDWPEDRPDWIGHQRKEAHREKERLRKREERARAKAQRQTIEEKEGRAAEAAASTPTCGDEVCP